MTSAGLATVTATLGNLTTSATITVVTGTLPVGTVRWTSAPGAPGAVVSAGPLFANRAEASVPDLYVLENTPAGSRLLHGVFADGTPFARAPVGEMRYVGSWCGVIFQYERRGPMLADRWSDYLFADNVYRVGVIRIPLWKDPPPTTGITCYPGIR